MIILRPMHHTSVLFLPHISGRAPRFLLAFSALLVVLGAGEAASRSIAPATSSMYASTVFSCADVTDVPQSQCEALVDLYNATAGEFWTDNTGWLAGTEVDAWAGITVVNGNVYFLVLPDNNLSGTLPASLADLTALDDLFLSGNDISGDLPAGIGTLPLGRIILGSNPLTGSIPDSFGDLVNLEVLNLANTQLSGSLPASLGNLLNAVEFSLQGNPGLSGRLPASFTMLTNLAFIDLTGSQVCIPPEDVELAAWLDGVATVQTSGIECDPPFSCALVTDVPESQCEALVDFYEATGGDDWSDNAGWLTGTEVAGWAGVEVDAGSVRVLSRFGNNLSGTLPPSMIDLPDLRAIDVAVNSLGGEIPDVLGELSELDFIYLWNNQFTGTIPSSLGNLELLEILALDGNQLEGEIPSSLGNLSNLRYLALPRNNLSGPIPEELGNLGNLETLWLFETELSGPLPASFANLTSVTNFQYAGTQLCAPPDDATLDAWLAGIVTLGTSGLTCFTECGSVTQISIDQCDALVGLFNATGGMDWTRNTGWLAHDAPCGWSGVDCDGDPDMLYIAGLALSQNNLSGVLPGSISDLGEELRLLTVDRNNLVGPIPASLGSLPALQILSIHSNEFDPGPLPETLGALANLTVLDAGDVNMTGPFPEFIETLVNLEFLGFFGNDLSGPMPASLGNLTNLQVFGVGENQLSGSVPVELGDLPLEYLYLNGNDFEGPLPQGFSDMEDLWVQGNRFTFEDLLPVLEGGAPSKRTRSVQASQTSVAGNWHRSGDGSISYRSEQPPTRFIYAPQQEFGDERNVVIPEGQTFVVNLEVPGAVTYQWYRNGDILPGEESYSLLIPGDSADRNGEYTVRATNPDLPDLTIISGPVLVQVELNAAPVAEADEAQTVVDTSVTIDVLANDTDDKNALDPTTVTITTSPLNGSAVANPDGSITYTPADGFVGNDQLSYTVSDSGDMTSNEASVAITVVLNVDAESSAELPDRLTLDGAYPNPFNPSTRIRFATPRTGVVDVVVYDVMGRAVETLVSGELSAGWHDISFTAGRFSSGLYLYTVRFEGRQLTGRMNLIK